MSSTLNEFSAMPRRQRRHGLARWWLAGLLVSCLLPSSLVPSDAFRGAERGACVCFWVPAILRAKSLWIARRKRALKRWSRRIKRIAALRLDLPESRVAHRRVAARDVLTQRGPPSTYPIF
ncbi:hypothetical protein B0H98_10179 [Vreelandella songnenensis]|uniref:Uncharacterized protein n=1 Tax=Vreelandella songnenensis TaxID=1176243 RepID=A0A2T0V7D6_9GAMM|nr:hypothetical protein [Halomonas songnenensis]PRY66102.1 hypothetical protein B0H98_10179 [Halomonas songnenensis]